MTILLLLKKEKDYMKNNVWLIVNRWLSINNKIYIIINKEKCTYIKTVIPLILIVIINNNIIIAIHYLLFISINY